MTEVYDPIRPTKGGHYELESPPILMDVWQDTPQGAYRESFAGVVGDPTTSIFNTLAGAARDGGSSLAGLVHESLPGIDAEVQVEGDDGRDEKLRAARTEVDSAYPTATGLAATLDLTQAVTPAEPVEVPARTPSKRPERERKFSIRPATPADIDAIVDVDLEAFAKVYSEYPLGSREWREEMKLRYAERLRKVGGKWTPVLLCDGEIIGVMQCCPTNKTPAEFESWEQTTNHGTLDGTYDRKGKYLYVVTLGIRREFEGSGGTDMLIADQMGRMLGGHYEAAFFESRMPGFRRWAQQQAEATGQDVEALSEQDLDLLAKHYVNETIERDGRQIPYDRTLRKYQGVGCRLEKLLPNAYNDAESMNYGVLCTFDGKPMFDSSILPIRLPDYRVIRWMLGKVLRAVGKSKTLTAKVF